MNHLNSKSSTTTYEGIFCGAFAGLGTRTIVAPLDLVKIRLQLQPEKISIPVLARTVENIAKNEGLRAFWKGNLPASLLYVTYSGCQFGTLRVSSNYLNTHDTTSNWPEPIKQFLSGALSGTISTTLTYPFDLLRTRGAASQNASNGLIHTIKSIYQKYGLGGFFHGSSTAIFGVVPYMGSFFCAYSIARDSDFLVDMPSWFPRVLSSSFIAAVFSKTLVMPLDTIRKRIQVHDHPSAIATRGTYSRNFFKVASNVAKTEGFLALYRGLSIAVLKAAPSSFFSVYLFELSCNAWQKARDTF